MDTGKATRLTRIATGDRYLIVPMDHGITMGPVKGLVDIESTIESITHGGADAIVTQRGIAGRVQPNLDSAGYIVHLNGSTEIGPDEEDKRKTATVEDAVRVGGDAVSFHINVASEHEPDQITQLANVTSEAARLGMPVLAMAYARGPSVDGSNPEAVAHAVRLAEEVGADVIKTSYTGDSESFRRVVNGTSKPVVIAGGSKGTDRETLNMVSGAIEAGAAGVSMGRSIFQHDDPEAITRAVSSVVHDDLTTTEAADRADLPLDS